MVQKTNLVTYTLSCFPYRSPRSDLSHRLFRTFRVGSTISPDPNIGQPNYTLKSLVLSMSLVYVASAWYTLKIEAFSTLFICVVLD